MNRKKFDYSILFVEDNATTRSNYAEGLRFRFNDVYEAVDSEDALNLYKSKKPDIIILDIDLPKMSGLEFLKKIRQTDINTKVILFTSYSDRDTVLDASVLKITRYLIKPIQRDILNEALNEAVKELENFTIVSKKTLQLKEGFWWDFERKELLDLSTIVKLTKREKDILEFIFESSLHSNVITYDDILFKFWEDNSESNLKTLKTFMSTIRKKLPKDCIVNEYGIGYKLGG